MRTYFLIIVLFFLVLLPILVLILVGVIDRWPWPELFPTAVSLRSVNYVFGRQSPFSSPFVCSLLVAATVTCICVVLALGAAVGVRPMRGKVRGFFDILFLMPLLLPSFVVAMGLHGVVLRLGLVERFATVVAVHVLVSFPYCLRAVQVGFTPRLVLLETQAASLGASPWDVGRLVTIPFLTPAVIVGASFAFLGSMGEYVLTSLVGGGEVTTLPLALYPFLVAGDRSLSAVASLLLVTPALVFIILLELIVPWLTRGRAT